VIADAVGSGVTRAQQPSERLAGGVRVAEHSVEPEAAVEGGLGLLPVPRVDLDERGLEVERDSIRPTSRPRPLPELGSHLRHRLSALVARPGLHLVGGPRDRGVRRDGAERGTTNAQVLDVEAGLFVTGEHERYLGESLPAIMHAKPVAAPGNGQREPVAKPIQLANGLNASRPTLATIPFRLRLTFPRQVLVAFYTEVRFSSEFAGSRRPQFPQQEAFSADEVGSAHLGA